MVSLPKGRWGGNSSATFSRRKLKEIAETYLGQIVHDMFRDLNEMLTVLCTDRKATKTTVGLRELDSPAAHWLIVTAYGVNANYGQKVCAWADADASDSVRHTV